MNDFQSQFHLSQQLLAEDKLSAALAVAEDLMRMAEQDGGIEKRVVALFALGSCFVSGDFEYSRATLPLQECLTLSEQQGDWTFYWQAKLLLGILAFKHFRLATGLESWADATEILIFNADSLSFEDKAYALNTLCSYLEEILKIKVDGQLYASWIRATMDLLLAYPVLSRNEDCIRAAQHILTLPLKDEDRCRVQERAGMTFILLGQPREALNCYAEGLSIAERIGSTSATISLLQNIAKAYKQTRSYDRAIASLERAELMTRQSGEGGSEIVHVNNLIEIGSIHREMGSPKAARPYLQSALQALESVSLDKTTSQVLKASALTNLGLLDSDEGNYDDAIKAQEEALQVYETGSFTFLWGLAQVESNLATALSGKGEIAKAIHHWEQSLSLNRQIGDMFRVSRALLFIAELEEERKNHVRYLAVLAEALEINRALGDLDCCSRILFNRARINETMGHTQVVLAEFEEASNLSESVGNLELAARSLSECARLCTELNDMVRTATFRKQAATAWRTQDKHEAAAREELKLIHACVENDCIELLEQPFEMLDRISRTPTLSVQAILTKAKLFHAEDRVDEALLTLNEILPNLSQMTLLEKAVFYVDRGVLLEQLNQIETGVDSFETAIDLIDSVSNSSVRGELWYCIGNSFGRMRKQTEAYIYLNHARECFKRAGEQRQVDELERLLQPINSQSLIPNLRFPKELWEYGLARKSGWTQAKDAGVALLPRSAASNEPATSDLDLQAVEEVISTYHELGVWEDPNLGIFNPTIDFFTQGTKFSRKTLINPLALTEGCLHFFFFRSDPLGKLAHVLDTCLYIGSGQVIFCSLPFLEQLANYLAGGETRALSVEEHDRLGMDYIQVSNIEAPDTESPVIESLSEPATDDTDDFAKTLADLTREIVIQSNRTLVEWVLAHEIGHAVLGHPSKFLDFSPSSSKFEQEADNFFIDCYRSFLDGSPGVFLHINLSSIILHIYHDYYAKEYGHRYTGSDWVTTSAAIHIKRDGSPHDPLIIRLLNLVELLLKYNPGIDGTDYFKKVRENIKIVEADA